MAVVLAVVGMSLGVDVYRAAVDRVAVVAVARPIAADLAVSADDLRQAFVPADSDLATVPWDQVDTVIGSFATTDLLFEQAVPPGASSGTSAPRAGEAVVGLSVQPGRVRPASSPLATRFSSSPNPALHPCAHASSARASRE